MRQRFNSLMMKMNTFFTQWDKMEDLSKYSEYDVARKMITIIERENFKVKPKAKLSLVKNENSETKADVQTQTKEPPEAG